MPSSGLLSPITWYTNMPSYSVSYEIDFLIKCDKIKLFSHEAVFLVVCDPSMNKLWAT